jgi:Ca2+-binding RTX toxin-like protein
LGNDTYVVDNVGDVVDETNGDGIDTVQSSVSFSLSDPVHAIGALENLTLTGSAVITGTGNDLDNVLIGNAANNVLIGLGGNDRLDGGLGADLMQGGLGNDTYVVDNVGDVVDETGGDGIDTVQASVSFSLADPVHALGDIENLTLTGTAAINGTGNALANTLIGNAGNNVLAGLGGADVLDGGAGIDTASYAASPSGVSVSLMTGVGSGGDAEGDTLIRIENLTGSAFNDTLEGDGGNNVLVGGGGLDTVSYEHALVGVTVSLAVLTAQNTIGAGIDTLSGFENLTGSAFNDTLTGDTNNNVLSGLAGNDIINGGAGDDVLVGGAGHDILTGGTGADTFRFALPEDSLPGNADVITDFSSAQHDKIDLRSIDAALITAGQESLHFIGAATFSGAAGELRFAGGDLSADLNGDGQPDFQVHLNNVTSLSANDLLL